jgi:UDP-glucose 4-epimerase
MSKNILITGGIGYLGSRMVDYLLKEYPYHNIYFTHYNDKHNSIFNEYKNVFFRKLDLNVEKDFNNICKNMHIVIHLAFPNEIVCSKDISKSIQEGVKGTYLLLEEAFRNAVERFIFFSTIHVYGENLNSAIYESSDTSPNHHPYAIAKKSAEDYVNYYNRKKGLNTTIVRLSNGFGAPFHKNINRHNLFFNDVCSQALTNRKIVLKSSSQKKMDFISFTSLFLKMDKICFQENEYKTINIGGYESISILEMTNKIAKRINFKLGIKVEIKKNDKEEVINENFSYNSNHFTNDNTFDEAINIEVDKYISFFK